MLNNFYAALYPQYNDYFVRLQNRTGVANDNRKISYTEVLLGLMLFRLWLN